MKKSKIYLASPHLSGKEILFIESAIATNWIAPLGKNVELFEKEIASYVGTPYAVALCSGTAAIHLALKWLGVSTGDYVLCSSLTFAGSCNPILYEQAQPVFIDSEPNSWNMCPQALEQALLWSQEQGKLPKAAIVVNLYGQSADYQHISALCDKFGVPIIEDAAESLGACYKGRQTGNFGALSVFSFNGNKIITTSGGGMLLSKDKDAIAKAKFWATQARDDYPYYHHTELGYNYRLSNISAGIGRGQFLVLEERIAKKKQIYQYYSNAFVELPLTLMPIPHWSKPNYWLSCATLNKECKLPPAAIIQALAKQDIEARHIWKPMHTQPLYSACPFFALDKNQNVAEDIFARGLCLPSDTKMNKEQQDKVIDIVKGCLQYV